MAPSRSTGTLPMRVLLVVIGTIGGLVVAELLLRAIRLEYREFYVADSVCGAALRPGARGWYAGEGRQFIVINSAGQRDREHQMEKPDGVYRIAVLGDSYAEAMQVAIDDAFWSVMAFRLAECGPEAPKHVEVINFGVAGYGTAQQLLTLRTRVLVWRPDLVVLAFCSGNDVRNNSRALEPQPQRPFFVLQDNQLVLDSGFLDDPVYHSWVAVDATPSARFRRWLRQHSRLVRLASNIKAAIRRRLPETERNGDLEAGLDDEIYRPPRTPEWQAAWAVTEELIRAVAEEAAVNDANFVLATVSNPIQVHPSPERRRTFVARLGGDADLYYPEKRLRRLCDEHGIKGVFLAPRMVARAEAEGLFLHGFPDTGLGTGHWNESGHRLAGELLAEAICGWWQAED